MFISLKQTSGFCIYTAIRISQGNIRKLKRSGELNAAPAPSFATVTKQTSSSSECSSATNTGNKYTKEMYKDVFIQFCCIDGSCGKRLHHTPSSPSTHRYTSRKTKRWHGASLAPTDMSASISDDRFCLQVTFGST